MDIKHVWCDEAIRLFTVETFKYPVGLGRFERVVLIRSLRATSFVGSGKSPRENSSWFQISPWRTMPAAMISLANELSEPVRSQSHLLAEPTRQPCDDQVVAGRVLNVNVGPESTTGACIALNFSITSMLALGSFFSTSKTNISFLFIY